MPAVRSRPVCRLHRFDGQVSTAIIGVRVCAQGHGHPVARTLYRCMGCGFPLTMPLEV